MSITIHQQPDVNMPVNNELPFVVSSDEENQPFFKFRVDLYHDNTKVRTFILDKWPTGGAVFDPAEALKGYAGFDITDLVTAQTGFRLADNVPVLYDVVFMEQYGSDSTIYASGTASGLVACNAALGFRQWVNLDIDDYTISQTHSGARFLTNSPRNIKIGVNEVYELGFMCDGYSTGFNLLNLLKYCLINTYDSGGNLIGFYRIDNPSSQVDGLAENFMKIMCGPYNLNNAVLGIGSQPVIDDEVAYYEIKMNDEGGTTRTETFRFTIDRECTRYTPYRILFLNRWGRFDAFTFKGYNRETANSERGQDDYSRRPAGVKDGNSYVYSPTRHQVYPIHTQYNHTVRLESGDITAAELAWLEELLTSPAVYYQESLTTAWAVNVKTTTLEKKTKGLFSIGFEIEYAHKSSTQQR